MMNTGPPGIDGWQVGSVGAGVVAETEEVTAGANVATITAPTTSMAILDNRRR